MDPESDEEVANDDTEDEEDQAYVPTEDETVEESDSDEVSKYLKPSFEAVINNFLFIRITLMMHL